MKTPANPCTILKIALLVMLCNVALSFAAPDQAAAIRHELAAQRRYLYYPLSVKRFYASAKFRLVWVAPDTVKTHAYDAMLLLDCVRQYGLNHADYHPAQLLYDLLNKITTRYAQASANEKAAFDIFLTDAMIRLVNDLHYGKLNPKYTAQLLDTRINDGVLAEIVVGLAVHNKNFIAEVERVQPRSEQYRELQHQMHLMAGVLVGDCYDLPEASLRNIAVNMERLRWMPVRGKRYIQVNIPSLMLRFHQQDTDLTYPVAVGRRQTPTPVGSGTLTGLSSGGQIPAKRRSLPISDVSDVEKHSYRLYDLEGKKPDPTSANIVTVKQKPSKHHLNNRSEPRQSDQINFELQGAAHVILLGYANSQLLKDSLPASTGGLVWVDHAEKLAAALLEQDGKINSLTNLHSAIAAKQRRVYRLRQPVPFYVTYLTCGIKNGQLETYQDIYGLDERVARALFKGTPVIKPYQ